MPTKFTKSAAWLFGVGFIFFRCWAEPSQNSSPVPPPATVQEFQENGLAYFPAGTFKDSDGSPDDHYGDSFAWYLHSIGEPPLLKSTVSSQAHAYRLMLIGFPNAKTFVLRLQIEESGSGKIFARETPFNGINFLLNKQDAVSNADVNAFLECVARADFWRLPTQVSPDPNVKILDGSYWFLEGAHRGEYHMIYRRNPESHLGTLTDVGRYLAKDLAHLDDSTIYMPRADRSEPLRRGDH
jgi:hypothetical protein